MKTAFSKIFGGTLNRKKYILSIVCFLFVGSIILQIAKELGAGVFVITFGILALIKLVFDVKRLRDAEAPVSIAPIVTVLYLLVWMPYTYDVMTGMRDIYSAQPTFLRIMSLCLVIEHIHMIFVKGAKDKVVEGDKNE
jgi:uncharacterized membrane protein YhaH (DUF805 family)